MSKIAIITGGNRGLGKNMGLKLAEQGCNIIFTYNQNEAQAAETKTEIEQKGVKVAALRLDLNAVSTLDQFVEEIKNVLALWGVEKFDFLVNNAGIGMTVPFEKADEAIFDQMMNIHFKSAYFLTQKLVNLQNEGGSIVNISSGTTRFCVYGYSIYAAMKTAMETCTKYWAKELGGKKIRVNIVAPGPVETDFNSAAIRNNPQMKSFLASQTALGRVGESEDIGGVVAFLCSEAGSWINGQRIEVSGGIML